MKMHQLTKDEMEKSILELKSRQFELENELVRNKERLSQFAELTGIWVWEIDVNGLYTYVGGPEESILGYPPEELVGKKYFHDFFAPDVKVGLTETAFNIFSQKRTFRNFENSNVGKNGQVLIIETSGSPILDQSGNLLGYRGAHKDVTKKKQSEKQLIENETKYRMVSENSLTGIYIIDNYQFSYVNHSLCVMFGYTPEELIGSDPLLVVHPDDCGLVKEVIRKQMLGDVDSLKYEFRCIKKNGEIIYVMALGAMCRIDGRNILSGNLLDVSESKNTLNSLDRLNRLYSVISHVNRAITEIKDKNKLYEEICQIAVNSGKFRMAWIGLIDQETRTIKPFAHAGFEEQYLSVIKPISISDAPEGRGPSGSAIREGKHFICYNFETDPLIAPWRNEALSRGYHSSIALPIKQSGNVIGAFTLYASVPYFFDQPEVELLLEITGDISFAIDAIELDQKHQQTILELVNSEQKYRMLTENMKDAVWIMNSETLQYIYISASFEKLLGYPVEEMIGATLKPCLIQSQNKDLGELFRERSLQYSDHNHHSDIQYFTDIALQFRKDGSPIHTEITTYYKLNPLSGRVEIHGLTRDVSERKLLEEQELANKNRLAGIFESITDGFVAFDDQMNYTYLNKRGAALLGYKTEELIGKNYWAEFPEAKGTLFANAYIQVMETQKPVTFDEYYEPWDRFFENRIYPTPEGIAVYFSETTERKRTEKLIAGTTDKLKQAQRLAHIGNWEANLDTGLLICSDEMYNILGYPENSELTVDDINRLFSTEELVRFKVNFKKARESKTPHKSMYRIIRPDGEERFIYHEDEVQKEEHGKVVLIFGTTQDITDRILAEDQILQTKEQFQTMFEHSPMGIALAETPTGKILESNVMFSKITGRSPQEIRSLNWMSITHKEDLQIGIEQMNLLRSKEIPGYRLVKRYYRPDGSIVWVNMTVAAIHNEGKTTSRHLTMIEDITEAKANEEQVLVLSRAVEQSPVSIVITDTKGNIEYVNEKFSQITGYTLEEAIGNNPRILKSNTKKSDEYKNLWDTITSGHEWHGEFLNVKKNGEMYSESASISPITDDEGKIVHFLAVKEDITERKKVIAQLKTLSAVVEQSPLMIIITGADLKIDYANTTFTNFMQYRLEEIKGETPWIFNSKNLNLLTYNQMQEALHTGCVWQMDSTNHKKDGTTFWEQVTVFPLLDNNGAITNYIIITNDISEKKQLLEDLIKAKEKTEESNQLKTAFINNISHEIRTPLNGILGFGDLVSQSDITQEERFEFLRILQQSTDRLVQTVTDYLDISKIVTENMEVNTIDFQVNELLDELMFKTKKHCSDKNVNILLEYPDKKNNLRIHSDRLLISKAMEHLLSNAAKFTNNGSITIGCNKLPKSLEFYVKDTGTGITKDKLKIIFNAFMQEYTSTTRGYEGSGLGLAIVRGISELIGGKVWAESEKGKGSEFYLSIPYRMQDNIDEIHDHTTVVAEKAIQKRQMVLIAEDNEVNFAFLEFLLSKAGFTVLHATDGAEAVDLCKNNFDIDLILMDIKMPVMDGIEATRRIKQFRPNLPIIAITAYAQTREEYLIRQSGCDDLLEKPFRREELLFKISKYI